MTSFLPTFIEQVMHAVEVVRKAPRGREPQISWIDAVFLFLYCLHTGLTPSKIAPAIGIANTQNLVTAFVRIRPLVHSAIAEVLMFSPKDQFRSNLVVRDPQAPLERFNNIAVAVDSTTFPIHKPQVCKIPFLRFIFYFKKKFSSDFKEPKGGLMLTTKYMA